LQSNIDYYKYIPEKEKEEHIPQAREVRTDYQTKSSEADKGKSKGYWSTNREMFARAFDAFVTDTIEEKSAKNTYLSGIEAISPKGEERAAINQAFRDLINEIKTRETDKGVEMYSRGQNKIGRQLTKAEVEKYARQLIGDSKNQPNLVVVNKVSDLPFDALEDAQGVLYGKDLFLVSEQISSTEDTNEVIFHEMVGHFGLRGFFGSKLDFALDDIHLHNPLIQQYAIEWRKSNLDLKEKYEMSEGDYWYRSIEEAMAKMAQENKPYTFADKLLNAIQSLLRKIGMDKLANALEAKSNAEALKMLNQSRLYIKKGVTIDSKTPNPLYPMYMTAWHGSPHTFDKFSAYKIGTGEGAQSYGYGLYFAGKNEVAEYYRRALSNNIEYYDLNGEIYNISDWYNRKAVDALIDLGINENIANDVTAYLGQEGSLKNAEREIIKDYADREPEKKLRLNALKLFKEAERGRLYKVELAPQEDEYLLWDKPLSEQSEKVKEALKDAFDIITNKTSNYRRASELSREYEKSLAAGYSASDLYGTIGDLLAEITDEEIDNKQKAASNYLHSLGIRGIKYLDGTSRGKGEGNYNYVIFSDDDVEIKERYRVQQQGPYSMPDLADVQEVFKGQNVTQLPTGAYLIKLKNGADVIISEVSEITPNGISLNIGYSKSGLSEREVIAGKYDKGMIDLVKGQADKWTLAHESVHFMEDIGVINDQEAKLLKRHIQNLASEGKWQTLNKDDIGGSEDRAEFLAQALQKEPRGLLGRIINKIQDFIDKLVNAFGIRTIRGIQRDVQTGNIYNRPTTAQREEWLDLNTEKASAYAIGQKLRESDIPVDDVAPIELNVKGTNSEIISRAAEEYKSWPEKITAADGSEILLANPEDGYISKRALHLVWDNGKDMIHIEKARWLPNVPGTLENAAVRLIDQESGNRIYVRSYNNNVKHMVVVAPDGHVIEQKSFKGKLVTQFPYAEQSRQDSMIIDWERKGEGRSQGTPNPTSPASAIPGSQQETFQNKNTLSEGKVKEKYSIRKQTDPPVSNDPKVLNLYLKDEADAIVQTIMNKLHPKSMTWLETMLKSPEWFDHPQIQNIVKLFMRDRNEIYHETFKLID